MKVDKNLKILICLFPIFLLGCENQYGKPKHPVIVESIVSINNVQNSDKEFLYFYVNVEDFGLGPERKFRMRFIIQDPSIKELIETEMIESPDTYKTLQKGSRGNLSASFIDLREINGDYTVEELKNLVENEQAVIVEIYDENEVITQKEITTFEDKRDK